MAKRKKPKQAHFPVEQKVPRHTDPDYRSKSVNWSFVIFDNYDWKHHGEQDDAFVTVSEHLKAFEGRTWAEIEANRGRDHPVDKDRLCSEARKRLRDLNRDDVDSLWRFRFTGPKRIWGIKQGRTLQVLWWDPNHRVCPSEKKNT
jgi:hypothetical protein